MYHQISADFTCGKWEEEIPELVQLEEGYEKLTGALEGMKGVKKNDMEEIRFLRKGKYTLIFRNSSKTFGGYPSSYAVYSSR